MKKILLCLGAVLLLSACSGSSQDNNKDPKQQDDTLQMVSTETMLLDTTANGTTAAVTDGTPLVVDFYATWCGPCKKLAPVFAQLEKKYAGKVKFRTVDVDKEKALADKYQIEGVPTVIVFGDTSMNRVLDRVTGYDPAGIEAAIAGVVP